MISLVCGIGSGCSTLIGSKDTYDKYSKENDKAYELQGQKQKRNSLINHIKGIYVDTSPVKVSDQHAKLLEAFPENIVISNRPLMSVSEIADRVTKLTRIPVKYQDMANQSSATPSAPGVTSPITTQNSGPSVQGLNMMGMSGAMPDLSSIAANPAAFSPSSMPSLPGINENLLYGEANLGLLGFPSDTPLIDARFSGSLVDFLDNVAGRTGLFWKFDYQENRIIFYKYDTKTFTLKLLPGDLSIDAELTNTSGTASSGSESTTGGSTAGQTIKLNSSIKTWSQTIKTVEKMLSKSGKAEGNEAIGAIVVVDTPMIIAEIESYIDQINKEMSRQVSFDVVIYDVELADDNKLGIDWDFVWNEAGKYATGFTLPSTAVTAIKTGASFVSNFKGNQAVGSGAVIKGLETQGRVALKTHQQTMTLNNTPVPIKIADETTYLASASSGTVPSSGASSTVTSSLTPGTIVSGLTMTMLPRIFDPNQLMLQMTIDITVLKSIDTIVSGTGSIQMPKLGTKSVIQRVAMKNNETLIMSGFDQENHQVSRDSSLDIPSGLTRNEKHVVTVIMITPRITEGLSLQ